MNSAEAHTPSTPQASLPLHRGWRHVLSVFHGAGLLNELGPDGLFRILGPGARGAPDVDIFARILDHYYRGLGDAHRGIRRRRTDRYVALQDGDQATAESWLAQLRAASPELGSPRLERGSSPIEAVILHACVAQVPLSASDMSMVEHGGLPARSASLGALVSAVNALLEVQGAWRRFVPLDGPDGLEAYLCVDPVAARQLDALGLFAESLDELSELTGWLPDVDIDLGILAA